MPEMNIYRSGSELPSHFYYQAQSFSRIIWYDSDDYDIDRELQEPLTHVVLANGKSLIAYAQVLWVEIEHVGVTYRCGGLSGVMTFPFFRKRGYGSQVVTAATDIIHDDGADIALLWTEPKNEHFYMQLGWEPMPHMTTLIGDREQPTIYDEELPMMRFISAKGREGRPGFVNGRVYVGQDQW